MVYWVKNKTHSLLQKLRERITANQPHFLSWSFRYIFGETFDRYMGMEPTRLQSGFDEIKELEDASEDVKRIFSLEFAPRQEIKKLQELNTLEGVDHDPTDDSHANYLLTSSKL